MDSLHISLIAEPVFSIGSFVVTNAMILGSMSIVTMLAVLFYAANSVGAGKYNRFIGLMQWCIEGFLGQAEEIIGDKKIARKVFPLAITMFFAVIVSYWFKILPGVGSITVGDVPIFRALPADLNFTFALAIIAIIASQVYAVQKHGFFGNVGRFFRNPFKDPIGAFEGILEFVGEFSRLVAMSFRLFGNAFAGEILLLITAILAGAFAVAALPLVMAFELFVGFIQAYVFFVLTLIFTSLALQTHGDHDPSHDHSPADTSKKATAAE